MIPRGKDDNISFNTRAITKDHMALIKTDHSLGALFEMDPAVDHQLAATKVDVVSPFAMNIQPDDPLSAWAMIHRKAGLLQFIEKLSISSSYLVCSLAQEREGSWPRETLREDINHLKWHSTSG
jgi:hypothetical protein